MISSICETYVELNRCYKCPAIYHSQQVLNVTQLYVTHWLVSVQLCRVRSRTNIVDNIIDISDNFTIKSMFTVAVTKTPT